MTALLTDAAEVYRRAFGLAPSGTVREMEAYGEQHGPSTIGRDLGRVIHLLTRSVDATRVFEIGSGYGYSAYWFASALPDGGEVVLTDTDSTRLAKAREFLQDAGLGHKATFVEGDAIETLERASGRFDVVLVDVPKTRYPAAYEAARDRVAAGGLLLADNAMVSKSVEFDALVELLDGGSPDDVDESTRGMATYLEAVRSDPGFESIVLPLGEGLAVSYRLGDALGDA